MPGGSSKIGLRRAHDLAPQSGHSKHNVGIAPEFFKVIISSPLLRKKVDYDAPQVDQYPSTLCFTFCGNGSSTGPFVGSLDDGVSQRPDLPVVIAATENKIIRKDSMLPYVKQQDIVALFVDQGIDQHVRKR